MIRKVFLVLISLSLFLFFSCGSTKAETAVSEPEPPVQNEEVGEESVQDKEESSDQEEEEAKAEEEASSEETAAPQADDINELYPPLEEIEEAELIELEPEEESLQVDEEAENQISEPIEEIEELPPLEPVEEGESAEGPEKAESTEGENFEGAASEEEASEKGKTADENETSEEGTRADEEMTSEEGSEATIEIEPEEEQEEAQAIILPSRSVSLKKGETLVITYPGNGWIYMGSTSEYNNLASRGRKLGTSDTKYTLLAKESGTQIHHFYKVDNLTGDYIDDYIEVTVLDKKGQASTVVNAPDYAELVPKKPETPAKASPKAAAKNEAVEEAEPTKNQTAERKPQSEAKATVEAESEQNDADEEAVIEIESEDAIIVIDEDNDNSAELEAIMEEARSALSSKNYDTAYPALVHYLELSTDKRDEALYLLGQILESNSKYKDIKLAVETYQTLCDNYPASKYWDKANKRIVYLKRFYINIH